MGRISRTAASRNDLYEIWIHIGEENIDAADRLIDEIEEKCALLSQFPGIGQRRDELRPGLRSLPVENYLIIYRETAKAGIHLVRVLHGARNLKKVFKRRRR